MKVCVFIWFTKQEFELFVVVNLVTRRSEKVTKSTYNYRRNIYCTLTGKRKKFQAKKHLLATASKRKTKSAKLKA